MTTLGAQLVALTGLLLVVAGVLLCLDVPVWAGVGIGAAGVVLIAAAVFAFDLPDPGGR